MCCPDIVPRKLLDDGHLSSELDEILRVLEGKLHAHY